ncbi:MAG: nucleoside phosphorylase [Ekhidna sp.]|nr:nucleoside phosphorylase [Ekhidna sp.]MBC6411219.1 nucleoside phosphorylase [Ekhidna sp.]
MTHPYSETDLILNPDGSVYHLSLRPKDITDKIVVVSDPGRVHSVSRFFDSVDFEVNKREFITHTGKYKGKRISVISSGMGTDNMEILMNELDALFNIDLVHRVPKARKKKLQIIRIGTSGAIRNDIKVGSHLATEYAFGLDTTLQFYKYRHKGKEQALVKALRKELDLRYTPYCFKGSPNLLEKFKDCTIVGNTVTCPGFYAPQGRQLRIPMQYEGIIDKLQYFHEKDVWITDLEMETAGYYAFAKLLGHEVISLNAILANRVKGTFTKDPNRIIDGLIKKVLKRI